MADLQYQYGGQWFDDMGALALTFSDAPRVGIDLANAPAPRGQINSMAKNLFASNLSPYDEPSGVVGQGA